MLKYKTSCSGTTLSLDEVCAEKRGKGGELLLQGYLMRVCKPGGQGWQEVNGKVSFLPICLLLDHPYVTQLELIAANKLQASNDMLLYIF